MDDTDPNNLQEKANDIAGKVLDTSKDELAHYIALRKSALDLLDKSLGIDDAGNYSSEKVVHDIIFPQKGDSEETHFEAQNLWILDERLNFTEYVSSDKPLSAGNRSRPDILVYGKKVLFREGDEPSNPVTIFEFKKPNRSDFKTDRDNPIDQLLDYVDDIKKGRCKTPKGRTVHVMPNTPFYGFLVCDVSKDISDWLKSRHDFKPFPDGMGWFRWWGKYKSLL